MSRALEDLFDERPSADYVHRVSATIEPILSSRAVSARRESWRALWSSGLGFASVFTAIWLGFQHVRRLNQNSTEDEFIALAEADLELLQAGLDVETNDLDLASELDFAEGLTDDDFEDV